MTNSWVDVMISPVSNLTKQDSVYTRSDNERKQGRYHISYAHQNFSSSSRTEENGMKKKRRASKINTHMHGLPPRTRVLPVAKERKRTFLVTY